MHPHTHPHHEHDGHAVHAPIAPYWTRAHRSWLFWVAVVLMFAAIMIYVLSLDLAWRPRIQRPATQSSAVGK